jgi:hypothetical protein
MEILPILPAIAAAFAGSARQRRTTRHPSACIHVTEPACYHKQKLVAGNPHPREEEYMKYSVRALFVVALFCFAGSFAQAEPRQLIQGSQIHLKLTSDISTASSRNGDPFIAVTTEPLMMGDQVILPAGTRIRGIVTSINRARRFSLFRGEAYMNLTFRSIEVGSRLIPVQMSVVALQKPSEEGEGRQRKDIDVTEGQLLQQKHDIKGDIIAGTIGMGGGTLIGKLASHAAAGFGIGLAGSAIYVSARKGKELSLPAETGMLVRMDSTVTVPTFNNNVGNSANERPASGQ